MAMSDPLILIECDKCGLKDECDLTSMAGRNLWSDAGVRSGFEADGWLFTDDGATICEDCNARGDY